MNRIESMSLEDVLIDALKWNNRTAPHQQDQWNWHKGIARTLSTATHGAGSHLTKTLILKHTRNNDE